MIKIKRAYDTASVEDGQRILVDRLWPRGVSKERASLDRWAKELAPSTELRKWFGHDPERWTEFQKRYRKELLEYGEALNEIAKASRHRTVTLVYGAKDQGRNEAVVLLDVIQKLASE
jgi:uncharacterized protein YeaO (DUF488 family)